MINKFIHHDPEAGEYNNLFECSPNSPCFPDVTTSQRRWTDRSAVYTIAFVKQGKKDEIFYGFTMNNRFLTNQIKMLLGSQLFWTYSLLPQYKMILYLNDNYLGLGFRICWKMQVPSS